MLDTWYLYHTYNNLLLQVARGLSPKAWRDLMPAVRKIGAQLVQEGLILVTQRGTIVDLATARGPVRFGLAK